MAQRVKATVTGAKEIIAKLQSANERWRNSLAAATYLEGNNIMARSKRLVPVDLGVLKASGYVALPQTAGGKVVVELGYGGGYSKDYAAVQHERLDFRHPEGGQAKYLEAAVDERAPQIAGNIMALAKAHFERGGGGVGKGPMPTDPDQGEQQAAAEAIGSFFRAFGGTQPKRKGGR